MTALEAALAEARAACAPRPRRTPPRRRAGLSVEQGALLFAITDAWNSDRLTRGLDALTCEDALTRILETTKGLVA